MNELNKAVNIPEPKVEILESDTRLACRLLQDVTDTLLGIPPKADSRPQVRALLGRICAEVVVYREGAERGAMQGVVDALQQIVDKTPDIPGRRLVELSRATVKAMNAGLGQ